MSHAPDTPVPSARSSNENVPLPGETIPDHQPLALEDAIASEEPFVIIDDSDDELGEGDDGEEAIAEEDNELDGLRIRQLVQLRRANFRSRTYAIVGMVVSGVAAVELVLLAHDCYRNQRWMFLAGYAATAVAAALGTALFAVHADRLTDELRRTADAWEHEPDFGPLSDGSHHVTNLENIDSESGNTTRYE